MPVLYIRDDTGKMVPIKTIKGAKGAAATVKVGSVTTLSPGSKATVTNTGTETDAVLNFGIPRGADGSGGSGGSGAPGEDGGYYMPTVTGGVLSWEASKDDMPAVASADIRGPKGDNGAEGAAGKDGTSVTVQSVSTSTEDGGTNVVTFSDGKTLNVRNGNRGSQGPTGATGPAGSDGAAGKDGTSVTITNISQSTADGGTSVVTFSDGKTLSVKNGSKGNQGIQGIQGIQGPAGADGKSAVTAAIALTVAAGAWEGDEAPYTATVACSGATASNHIQVGAGGTLTVEQYAAMAAALIVCTGQGADSITLSAFGEMPTIDLPVNVMIVG